jgi:hypothetical protein
VHVVDRSSTNSTLLLAIALSACSDGKDSVSRAFQTSHRKRVIHSGSGSTSKLLGRAAFGDPGSETFKIKRITGDWQHRSEGQVDVRLAVQTIDFPKGSHSGWHSHPGPVFIQVVSEP